MQTLYLKLHPACLAYLSDRENYGAIGISTCLRDSGELMKQTLLALAGANRYTNVVVEKCFLRLRGSNQRRIASDVIHIQRTFGVLLYLINTIFPGAEVIHISAKTARERIYNRESISKDTQLSEATAILKNIRESSFRPLQILCLHDCLVLKSCFENHLKGNYAPERT